MNLREMRFAKIEGTEVMVQVQSAAEAKSAIKELKHKKKEITVLRRRMQKLQRAAARKVEKQAQASAARAKKKGVIATLSRISRVFKAQDTSADDLQAIERDLDNTEEILHNIESCIVQLEGKLLT